MLTIGEALQPETLSEFKGMGPHMPTTEIDIPEKEENRFPTDRNFLIAFGVCVVLLMPFLIYTLCYSDLSRLYLQDDCGNICGEKNPPFDDLECQEEDYTDKIYLKRTEFGKTKCVEDCGKGYEEQYGLCAAVGDNATTDIVDINQKNTYMYLSSWAVVFKLILSSLVTVGVSIAVLFLFRYAVGCVVWTIIVSVIILGTIAVGLSWSHYANNSTSLTGCLLGTAFLALFIFLAYWYRDRIRLAVLVLTEATSAVFAIPSLFVAPICTFAAQTVILTLFLITTACIVSTGQPVRYYKETTFEVSDGMAMTIFYNSVVTLWALYFVGGVQYMVIGGAVSEWYFARDKTNLYKPVKRSFARAYRFHLGTVAFGSLIVTLATMVRAIINGLTKNRFTRKLVDFCLRNILELLNFITKQGYTITAMHGQPFLKSSKRAARLLATNLLDVVTINIIVDLTLIAVVILIALVSVLLSAIFFIGDPSDKITAEYIVFFMALFSGITFVSVFQTTIGAIFLCFCEDKLVNDGMARPYAMSRELMEFVENAKKAVGVGLVAEKQSYGQVEEQSPSGV